VAFAGCDFCIQTTFWGEFKGTQMGAAFWCGGCPHLAVKAMGHETDYVTSTLLASFSGWQMGFLTAEM
jgi:hypothetical protein